MKKLINSLVGVAKWLPLSVPYALVSIMGVPARHQVRLMPSTLRPMIVWVPLASIVLETRQKHRFPHLRFCWPGSWDREFTQPLCSLDGSNGHDSPFVSDFDTVRQVCRDEVPLTQVEEYRAMLRSIQQGGNPRGCATQADIEGYFSALHNVSKSIRSDGYKTSAELGGLVRDEVSVWITRKGEFVYGGWANHRLALAFLHDVERVPVSILGAHPDWLEQLCERYSMPLHRALAAWARDIQS